jgi:membrane associated rhomboid family serine protease
MIPISDENPAIRAPYVNWAVIGICIAVYLFQLTLGDADGTAFIYRYGVIPDALLHGRGINAPFVSWPPLTLITSMFMHGGLLHLAGNMLYLWIFGNNVEDALGHVRYAVFYLLCGMGAALGHALVEPNSTIPMLGASGAISGVLAGYVLIFPRARITVIIPLGILLYPFKISAVFVVGFWFVLQLAAAWLPYLLGNADPNQPGIAFWAHVGGFVAGLALAPFLSRLPLFGRHRPGPWG